MSNSAKPPQAVLDQIIGLYNQGELEQTVSLAESLAGQYPNTLLLYDILGAAHMGLKNADKTIASYQKVLQLNPNHTDAHNNMGMALYDQGRFDEAVESYQKAVKLEPDFADAHYNLGNALKQKGDLKQAIESYKSSLAINPDDIEILDVYGNALREYGNFSEAIEAYEQVIKIHPDYAEAYFNLGVAQKSSNEISAAIQSYKQAIKINPDFAVAYYNLGNALKGQGELDAAINSYKQAININPKYAEAYSNMGIVLKNKDDLNAAIESYKQAICIKPDYAEARQNLHAVKKKAVPAWHLSMMNDKPRNTAYLNALKLAIGENDFVLEIGTGSGLLSMMAANFGAENITTCESSETIAKVAKKIIQKNGYGEKISVINKKSTDLIIGEDLPKKADVVVSEILSAEFVGEGVRSTIVDANRRKIKKNGKMIPEAGEIIIALVEVNEWLQDNISVGTVNGFDLSDFNSLAPSKFIPNLCQKPTLLSNPKVAFKFDLYDTNDIWKREKVLTLKANGNGLCLGIIQWLRVQLFKDIEYENNPSEIVSHWPTPIYAFDKPLEVKVGQELEISAALFEDTVWFYKL